MKTNYTEIVQTNAIGKAENPIALNNILKPGAGFVHWH